MSRSLQRPSSSPGSGTNGLTNLLIVTSTLFLFLKTAYTNCKFQEEINSENTKTQILKNKQIAQEKLIHELSNINEQSLTDITNNIESYQKTISKLSADILELENDNAKILTQISELGFYEKEKNKFVTV